MPLKFPIIRRAGIGFLVEFFFWEQICGYLRCVVFFSPGFAGTDFSRWREWLKNYYRDALLIEWAELRR